jgi:hypothetical protein
VVVVLLLWCGLVLGEMRLFVCSNDDSIKVYTLPAMQNTCTIR